MKRQFLSFALVMFALVLGACTGGVVPEQGSDEYAGAVKSFYVGLAAIEAGDDQRAITELNRVIELAPTEPAAFNNLGILYLRQRDLEKAAANLEKASGLASENATVVANLAELELAKGDAEKALGQFRKAVELDPKDHVSQYTIAEESEKQGKDAEALSILKDKLKNDLPENLALNVEIARLAAKIGDAETLIATVRSFNTRSENWSPEIREQLTKLSQLTNSANLSEAARQTAFLKNVLLREPEYRSSLAVIKASDTAPGRLIRKPLVLSAPAFKPAPADTGITFEKKIVADVEANTAFVVFKDGEKPIVAYSTEDKTVIGVTEIPVSVGSPKQVAQIDFDYDFRIDLAFATEKGFRLFKQKEDGTYEDVTSATGLTSEITGGSFTGVWAFDYDSDGDLDLVLAPREGAPYVLRNQADGKFSRSNPFSNVENAVDFVFGDFDADGDSDAAFLDVRGTLSVFANERGTLFRSIKVPNLQRLASVSSADIDRDGSIDLFVSVQASDVVVGASQGSNLEKEIVNLTRTIPVLLKYVDGELEPEEMLRDEKTLPCQDRTFLADFDNNGSDDILTSSRNPTSGCFGLFLNREESDLSPANDLGTEFYNVSGVADLNGDGHLDVIGMDADSRPAVFENRSTKNYHWQIVRPKAAKTEGDQRINSYGIGGEMELRSGLLAQKRQITSPHVHFGLGENTSADVLRIVWQNGYVQAEFDLKSDQIIEAEQRLKGSCPHLFAWNGERFEHVKDAPPWSPALGLKINAQDTYGILQTEEWFKIPGEALQPKNGKYELRITGEYWESFYLDHYRLLAVDHPEGTEIFTDERFSIPLPPLEVFTTGGLNRFASATDHNGRDVLETVSKLDEEYLDGIERGKYQGVAEDHWVELELPEDAPREGKLWIVGEGWVHPTDASINVQRGQASPAPPKSLSIEIPDGRGGWKAVRENLGFPAGKMKNVLLDISDVFPADAKDRRLRLRTELEIFWDRLSWAVGKDGADTKITELGLTVADLRYRGFSVIDKRDDSSPEIPDYNRIRTTAQKWRDLEGYYTRFGDVLELLEKTDDRYVLSNAGDELALSFSALPDPPKGWKRDFVIIGNGWIKDGDLNSVFSKTLLPLPTHSTNDYSRPPTVLEDDPVYRKNRADWVRFHTRYVAPEAFNSALR
ncbi:MAG TPA: FG-GAP-like repeat-containing protein [Aridibacter sp.]|nr:FG-GAP-like repeat-containing protein [Aridibacter sp.]